MVRFQYRDFYDVPRLIFVEYRGRFFLLDSGFDEVADEYHDGYDVYLMPESVVSHLMDSWEELSSRAVRHLGCIPVNSVVLDSTKRDRIDPSVLEDLGQSCGLWE